MRLAEEAKAMTSMQSQIINEQIALLYEQLPTRLLVSLVVACMLITAVWGLAGILPMPEDSLGYQLLESHLQKS